MRCLLWIFSQKFGDGQANSINLSPKAYKMSQKPNKSVQFRPVVQKHPRISLVNVFQSYLTVLGWLLWMVFVGFFSLRTTERSISINLGLSLVIAALTFIDLFGLWLTIGRWRAFRTRISKEKEILASRPHSAVGNTRPKLGKMESPNKPDLESINKGIFGSMEGPPEQLRKQIVCLGCIAVVAAVAILLTGLSGWPLFTPGTGTIKGSIALALTVWIFIEPLPKDAGPRKQGGVLTMKSGLGFALLCFASNHYFPWFGGAGILAGGAAMAMGKRGGGFYALCISAASLAMQWWGFAS